MCRKCRTELPEVDQPIRRGQFIDGCFAAYYYEEMVAESVRRFKFRARRQYAGPYGRLLAMRLLRERVRFDVLTWVPTSKERCRKRGYDQTRLLAQSVARELQLPCTETLCKTFHNNAQSRLHDAAARKANVLGVYEAVQPERFAGKRVLLIDDVVTSGATLSECAKTLRIAGADSVVCAAFAAVREKEQKQ